MTPTHRGSDTKSPAWSGIWLYGLYVLSPLLLAAVIYATLRIAPPKLIYAAMSWGNPPFFPIPSEFDWIVYNVPDGLWSFSMTSFLLLTCKSDSRSIKIFYLFFGLACMLGLELFQGSVLSGTFDLKDVLAILIGFVFSIFILSQHLRTRCLNTSTNYSE
jgi:hypothetical protein